MGLLDAAAGAITGTSKQAAKMRINVESDSGTFEDPFLGATTIDVMFNPVSIARAHTATWTPSPLLNGTPTLRFASTPLNTIAGLQLVFDTTEATDQTSSAGDDVRLYTQPVSDLTRIRPRWHRPPLCQLTWGEAYDGNQWFEGVATSVSEAFTYFSNGGKPLRATLSCNFMQWNPAQTTELQSTDVHKSHVVTRGDTLHSIAREQLHDAALWRVIAAANRITDPFALQPGRVLHIPTVKGR